MRYYLHFLWIGLVLGLFVEAQLKLVAGSNPPAFAIAMVAYPILVTLSFIASKIIDRSVATIWLGDVVHYLLVGIGGLLIEWNLLGNPPSSNAFQLGMFGMWTTFGFGPRVLTRSSTPIVHYKRSFWSAFTIVAVLLTLFVSLSPTPEARLVIAVLALSATYIVWSVWLLILAWQMHRSLAAETKTLS